jgi:hypothetical protein
MECKRLQEWASGKACALLEGALRAGTRYNLGGCGCEPPQQDPESEYYGGAHFHTGIWAFLITLTLLGVFVAVPLLLYRSNRRAKTMEAFDERRSAYQPPTQLGGDCKAEPLVAYDDVESGEPDQLEYHAFTEEDEC